MTEPLVVVTAGALLIGGPCHLEIVADAIPEHVTDLAYVSWSLQGDETGEWWRSLPSLSVEDMIGLQGPCEVRMLAEWSDQPGYGWPDPCDLHCECGPVVSAGVCGVTLIYSGPVDQTCDGLVNSADVLRMLTLHALGVDFNEDGKVNTDDVLEYLGLYAEAQT